ncbi:hypothetical protein HAX54_052666, partial [Datura stramonium]|nr:hypothetical protein [Datura stramonium]
VKEKNAESVQNLCNHGLNDGSSKALIIWGLHHGKLGEKTKDSEDIEKEIQLHPHTTRPRIRQQQVPHLQFEEGGDESTMASTSESSNEGSGNDSASGTREQSSLSTKDNSAAETSSFERRRQ